MYVCMICMCDLYVCMIYMHVWMLICSVCVCVCVCVCIYDLHV
jgi:hypothetical protein